MNAAADLQAAIVTFVGTMATLGIALVVVGVAALFAILVWRNVGHP